MPATADSRSWVIAQAIRETCSKVDARLTELGVPYMETGEQPSAYVGETTPG
jgi:hypothetical protein